MPRNCLTVLLLFACLGPVAQPPRAAQAASDRNSEPAHDSFLSGGKRVRVETFVPARPGRYPALVLLHGLDGLDGPSGATYRDAARRLAARGHVVLLVHYFDRTATPKKALPGLWKQFRASLARPKAGGKEWQALRATFVAWRSAVGDAVAHARRLPQVDPEKVGLAGISMGGFLAASAAAQPELRVRCVAVLFGGLPGEVRTGLRRMPPTLIIHGQKDEVVPVREAHVLRDRLKALDVPCEVHIYENVGHVFTKADGKVCFWTALAAEQRTVAFLARHLGKAAPAAKVVPAPPTSAGAGRQPGRSGAKARED